MKENTKARELKARLKDVERLRQELATETEAFEAEKTDHEIALKRKQEKMLKEIEVMCCLQGFSLVILTHRHQDDDRQ